MDVVLASLPGVAPSPKIKIKILETPGKNQRYIILKIRIHGPQALLQSKSESFCLFNSYVADLWSPKPEFIKKCGTCETTCPAQVPSTPDFTQWLACFKFSMPS